MKLSAVRSPVRMERAAPRTVIATTPGCTAVPSGASTVTRSDGSTRRKTSTATPDPAITPGDLATMRASARRSAGTVHRVVKSPGPTSSASAAPIRSRAVEGGGISSWEW